MTHTPNSTPTTPRPGVLMAHDQLTLNLCHGVDTYALALRVLAILRGAL